MSVHVTMRCDYEGCNRMLVVEWPMDGPEYLNTMVDGITIDGHVAWNARGWQLPAMPYLRDSREAFCPDHAPSASTTPEATDA